MTWQKQQFCIKADINATTTGALLLHTNPWAQKEQVTGH